jgi:hypothetical protein
LYRVYTANSIYGIGRGEILKYKYSDLISGNTPAEDTRTGNEIAANVIDRLGLRFEE